MFQLWFWLFLMLGQYNINFYTDCTLVTQEETFIEFACILPTGEIIPIIVEFEEKENSSIPIRSRSNRK